nr:NADH dehydrogenase subunit 6 [Leucoptera malifoliella]
MLINMIMMISILIFFMKTPLSLGMLIIIQTSLICLMLGMIINSYWFSYILFMVFIGGMLILFIYVSSIASNEIFSFQKFLLFTLMFMFLSINFYLYNKFNLNNFNMNYEMHPLNYNFIHMNYEYKLNNSKMYNNNMWMMMNMLIIYLFITLIAVIKIININYGPLRSTNY